MANGKHCPECRRDVGFRAVAFALVRIRCPHCRAGLYHVQSRRMALTTALVSLGAVVAALAGGALAGWRLRAEGVAVALVGGIGVCASSAFVFGALGQIALAPVLRRTQRLASDATRPEPIEEQTW